MEKKKGTLEPKIPVPTAKNYVSKARYVKTKIDPISDEFIPKYKTEGAACCDLKANLGEGQQVLVGVGESVKIPVGFKMQLHPGYEAQIRARSGIAARVVIVTNGIGTIDEDYRDELEVLLTNLGKEPLEIKHGGRIAQMALKPVFYFDFEVSNTLDNTDRTGGFGSTGI